LLSPGLSVIAEAVMESRRISQRMLSFLYYRIAATIHILTFLTISLIALQFWLPPSLILIITLLNDFTVITIAYDRADVAKLPTRIHVPSIFVVALCLGATMVCSSFILLYVVERELTYSRGSAYNWLALQISIVQQFSLLSTRQRKDSCVRSRPSWRLITSILLCQIIATLLAIFGVFSKPGLSWMNAGVVWLYSIGWVVLIDVVKQIVERLVVF
jgi:H+-transporting ATPase